MRKTSSTNHLKLDKSLDNQRSTFFKASPQNRDLTKSMERPFSNLRQTMPEPAEE